MFVIIRDGNEVSLKTRFVIQLSKMCSRTRLFYVFRNEEEKFREKWDLNQVELATSTSGIFVYFLLMILKSPEDIRIGLLERLFHKKRLHVLVSEGFISVISQVLSQYFGMKARTDRLMLFLHKLKSPKIFLIDEFWSINTVNLKLLKCMGPIIYVSQDLAYNRFGFGDNFIAKKLMYRLEQNAVNMADVVIACSERDRFKYGEMGAIKTVFYPNIYPFTEFVPINKDQIPSISIVLQGHWGERAKKALEEIFTALSQLNIKIRVYMIGIAPQKVPKNIELQHYPHISSRLDYLNALSRSWIGINIGIHLGGTNERKYDYAMAGLVVFSDNFGARGDLLPHEYTYVDSQDLAGKLDQLLEFDKAKIVEMGSQNREQSLFLVERQREILLSTINSIT